MPIRGTGKVVEQQGALQSARHGGNRSEKYSLSARGSLKICQFIHIPFIFHIPIFHYCLPLYNSEDCSLQPPDSILHFLKRPSRKPLPPGNEADAEPKLLPCCCCCSLFCVHFFSSSRAEIVSDMRFANSGQTKSAISIGRSRQFGGSRSTECDDEQADLRGAASITATTAVHQCVGKVLKIYFYPLCQKAPIVVSFFFLPLKKIAPNDRIP